MTAQTLKTYSLINTYINGILSLQTGTISFERMTNSQPVATISGGYQGESPGAAVTEATIEGFNPVAGFEPAQLILMNALDSFIPVTFTFYMSSSEYQFDGFVLNNSFSQSTDSKSTCTFKVRGSYALVQAL